MDLKLLSEDFKISKFYPVIQYPRYQKKSPTDIIVNRTFNLVPSMIQKITCKSVVMVTWTNKQKGSALFEN